MIFKLVKRDPAWLAAIIMAPMIGVGALLFPRGTDFGSFFVQFQVATIVLLSIESADWVRPRVRATTLELALPIEGRDLFIARLLSFMALVSLPIVAVFVATLVVRGDLDPAYGMLKAAPILTLALLLPLAIRLPEASAPLVSTWALWLVVGVTGGLSWNFLPPLIVMAGFGTASAAVLIYAWPRVPRAFQFTSLQPAKAAARPRIDESPVVSRSTVPWRAILRMVFPGAQSLLYFVMGLIGPAFFFFPVFVLQASMDHRRRSRWPYTLPLSYRALLLLALAASVFPMAMGLAIGTLPIRILAPPDDALTNGPIRDWDNPMQINPTLEFWQYAPGSRVPIIQAPWGETIEPAVFSTLGFSFYDPYTVGPRSSGNFHEWQFERATTAIYGRSVKYEEYTKTRDSLPMPVTERPFIWILSLAAFLMFCFFLVFIAEAAHHHRLSRFPPTIRLAAQALIYSPVIITYGVVGYLILFRYSRSFVISAAVNVALLWIAQVGNPLAILVIAVTLMLAMYWLLERQFGRSEWSGKMRPLPRWF
jgi:hypothetical protein